MAYAKTFISVDGGIPREWFDTIDGARRRSEDLTPYFEWLRQWFGRRAAARYARLPPTKRPTGRPPLVKTGASKAAVLAAADSSVSKTEAEIGVRTRGQVPFYYLSVHRKGGRVRRRDVFPPVKKTEREALAEKALRFVMRGAVSDS